MDFHFSIETIEEFDHEGQSRPVSFGSKIHSTSREGKGKEMLQVICQNPKTEIKKVKVESKGQSSKLMTNVTTRRMVRSMDSPLLWRRYLQDDKPPVIDLHEYENKLLNVLEHIDKTNQIDPKFLYDSTFATWARNACNYCRSVQSNQEVDKESNKICKVAQD